MKVQKMCQKTVRLSHLVAAMVAACAVFSASGAATTYVVPEGTEGNTPTAPYDSWATAANNPRVAADATDAGGTIYILGGNYPASNRIAPEANVHVKIMATQSTAGTYGEMLISNIVAGYTTAASPGNRTFQVEGGTIKMTTGTGSVFTEYVPSGAGWGYRHYARLVLTGGQTKLDTTLASATYVGFSSKNCEMVVKDGAKLRTQNCYVCRQAPSCTDFNFLIADGASVECSSAFTFARPASGPDVMTNCLLLPVIS